MVSTILYQYDHTILWMEEILHQLKAVVYPIISRVLTILLVVQDFAGPSTLSYHKSS